MSKWYELKSGKWIDITKISVMFFNIHAGYSSFMIDGIEMKEDGDELYNAWHDYAFPSRKPKEDKTDEQFEEFWKQYKEYRPSCGSKTKARGYWDKISLEDREEAFRILKHYYIATDDGHYMKHAERYLRDRVWEGVAEQQEIPFSPARTQFWEKGKS